MAAVLPLRLLSHNNGNFFVFDPSIHKVDHFDIISYTWGENTTPHKCGIPGVHWDVVIRKERLKISSDSC
jgi:hypothetical protein